MAQHKIVLRHTQDILLIGVGLNRRLLLLGFGLTLALLALTGILRLLSHGGLAAAILLPVLVVMIFIGAWAMYASLATNNDVYDKTNQCFLRYTGNLLFGKRIATCLPLDRLQAVEKETTEDSNHALIFLRTDTERLNISDYSPITMQVVQHFLGFDSAT